MKTWTADELSRFLDFVTEDRLYAAWVLAATTGMRRGEVLGLRWSDVDLDAPRLSVRQTLVSVAYETKFSAPTKFEPKRVISCASADAISPSAVNRDICTSSDCRS